MSRRLLSCTYPDRRAACPTAPCSALARRSTPCRATPPRWGGAGPAQCPRQAAGCHAAKRPRLHARLPLRRPCTRCRPPQDAEAGWTRAYFPLADFACVNKGDYGATPDMLNRLQWCARARSRAHAWRLGRTRVEAAAAALAWLAGRRQRPRTRMPTSASRFLQGEQEPGQTVRLCEGRADHPQGRQRRRPQGAGQLRSGRPALSRARVAPASDATHAAKHF